MWLTLRGLVEVKSKNPRKTWKHENNTNMSKFHPLEVVDRGSETQLEGDENFNYLIYLYKG